MIALDAFRTLAGSVKSEWAALSVSQLQYSHGSDARLMLVSLAGVSLVLLVGRMLMRRRPGRHYVMLPAVPASMPRSLAGVVVHAPLVMFLAGVPFLAIALADPYTALVRRETSYPGRRICLAIDASNSMSSSFRTSTLRSASGTDGAFFTTVAAAERFVQMRMNGRYRDLVALVEFGSEAYVVTPFTNDYDNILLSLSLIGDPREFSLFPDPRTLIGVAIEQSVALFKAFKFLDASGNLLVLFSDGEDTNATVHGRSLDDIIRSAVEAKVPVYFVRTNYDRKEGDEHVPDRLWSEAVKQTGGKFFAASDEPSLLAAIHEIDQVSAGTIEQTVYTAQQPRFAIFAALAAICFFVAIASKLTVPYFRKFP